MRKYMLCSRRARARRDPKHEGRYRMDGGVAGTTCYTQAVNWKEVGGDIPLCPERRYKNPHLALPLALTPTLHVFCELLQQAKDAARQPYQKEEVVVPRLVRMDRERDRRR